jgi:2-polyprenyl-3-methyl-5-hydroxy-6-metoxy-1,4-benzoquinol methylase
MIEPAMARLPGIGEVRDAYNSKHADCIIRDQDRFYRMVVRYALEHLDPDRRGRARCLDVGCGGGYLLREIARLRPQEFHTLHGIEVSDMALREAKRQAPSAGLILAQGEALPYPDTTFDVVVCLGNLEHFIDPHTGARELARVCRPDGKVWILLPNSFYSGDIWRVICTGYGPNHHQILDRFATINEWRDLLEQNGLQVEKVMPYNRFKWWKRLLPRNLAYHFLYRARRA